MPDRHHACPTGHHAEPSELCYHNHGCHCPGCREHYRLYMAAKVARCRTARTCPNCGGPGGIYARGKCSPCREYRRRTGRERPPHVYDPPPRHCANCDARMPAGKPLRHGRCEACARYHDRNGRERPARLHARAA